MQCRLPSQYIQSVYTLTSCFADSDIVTEDTYSITLPLCPNGHTCGLWSISQKRSCRNMYQFSEYCLLAQAVTIWPLMQEGKCTSLGTLVHIPGKASTQPQVLEVDIGIETVFSVVCRSTSRLSHKIFLHISDILAKQSKGNTLNIAAVLDGIQILQGCPLWTTPWRIRGRRRQQWGDNG